MSVPGPVPVQEMDPRDTTQPMERDRRSPEDMRREREQAEKELRELQQQPPFIRLDEHFEDFSPDQDEPTIAERP
jgi:hypothetical protein